jgi:peptidoglycan hydrolase-like protein with peptidoglycan-binding domain
LGVGDVHDRGGAILSGKDYDRIDVWMGRGEEGLARALNWGARIVEGEVYWSAHQIEPGLSFGWVSSELPKSVADRMRSRTVQNPEVFNKPITQTSNKQNIQELQEALIMFGYYHGAIDGVYNDKTRKAVLTFQLVEGVIASENDAGAGNFGPKTTATLKKKLEEFNAEVTREIARLQANQEMLISNLGKKSSGEDVVALQRMLWELGYYHGALNGEYNSETINAVFEFQKTQGILDSEWDSGAGFYGKKTHTALTTAVNKKIESVGEYPMQMQTWVPAKKDLPLIASLEPPQKNMERQTLSFAPELMNTKVVQPAASAQLLTGDLDLNDRGENVVILQNILIKNGYLSAGLNTGYFGYKTKTAVLAFQLEKGIVSSEYGLGAGRAGPRTRAALNSL